MVIRRNIGDLFLETFASLVEVNPVYTVPDSQVGVRGLLGWDWVTSEDPLMADAHPPVGAGGLYWLHADSRCCEAGEDV